MQQDIVVELEKRKRNLQYMAEDMFAQRRAEMLKVLVGKVHYEIKQQCEMYDAMDSFMGVMKSQLCVHIERMVEKEVSF